MTAFITILIWLFLLCGPGALAATGGSSGANPVGDEVITQSDDNDYSNQAPEASPAPPETGGATDYTGPRTEYAYRQKRRCMHGYVWREAFPGDSVCVTPQIRAQAARDNRAAARRKQPGGGPDDNDYSNQAPYGRDTCRQGFVWREASPTDHVCVTPQIRAQAAYDNSQALSHTVPFKLAPH